jgi:phage shock protein A
MSLWVRFKRWVRSLFGGAIAALEDPRLILEQNIRELNDQVPKMNENIATVKANVLLLQKEVRRNEQEVEQLVARIKAAIQAGRDDIAQQYAMQLERTRETLVRTKEQLQYAEAAYEKALQVKQAFLREKERKIQEAKEALRAHERAKWQAKVADALEQFEVGGLDQTHEEMIQRLREETARSEARLELALDSVDVEALKIEKEAEALRAAELVRQFKLEMGLLEPEPRPALEAPASEKTVEPAREVEETKTIGRQRTR